MSEIICGIYKITSPKGKIYIGQSTDINFRWSNYIKLYCKKQAKLYGSLKKYGVSNHKFEVIEECSSSELNNLERFWQDEFDVLDREKGLNLVLTTCDDKIRILSDNYKDSIRRTLIENSKTKFDPIYQYNFEGILIKTWYNCYQIKNETKYSIDNIAECYRLINITAYGFIWRREETTFEKTFLINAKKVSEIKSKKVLQLTLNGDIVKEWNSPKDVELKLNIFSSSISACCRNERKTAGKFKWQYKQ